jgi:hypothetical protein
MRDPHVERVVYRISSDASIRYDDPEQLTVSSDLGEFQLSGGQLTIVPSEHFSTEAAARAAIEPYLRSWEMETDLTSQIRSIRFEFDRSDLIDRNPLKLGEPAVLTAESASFGVVGADVSLVLTRKNYPDPPKAFTTTPEVEMAYRRWLSFKEGNERLPAMAYFVLTVLEHAAGGRKQAAATYRVEKSILDTVGRLSSEKGDPNTARKARAAFKALSDKECKWLEEAARKLRYRIGEHASGKPLLTLRMQDLPPICSDA